MPDKPISDSVAALHAADVTAADFAHFLATGRYPTSANPSDPLAPEVEALRARAVDLRAEVGALTWARLYCPVPNRAATERLLARVSAEYADVIAELSRYSIFRID